MKRFSCLLAIAYITLVLTGCNESYYARYTAGPIQAIGNKEQLWLFLEMDRLVTRNSSVYDAPSTYPAGHFQEILILDSKGLQEQIKVLPENNVDGVTFHPNNTIIFSDKKKIYIYSIESMDFKDSLFRWDAAEKRFLLLPYDIGNEMLNLGSPSSSTPLGDIIKAVKSRSQVDGWDFYYSDTKMSDTKIGGDQFSWNGIEFTVSVKNEEEYFEIKIDVQPKGSGYPILLKYNREPKLLDSTEYESRREEYGHPK